MNLKGTQQTAELLDYMGSGDRTFSLGAATPLDISFTACLLAVEACICRCGRNPL